MGKYVSSFMFMVAGCFFFSKHEVKWGILSFLIGVWILTYTGTGRGRSDGSYGGFPGDDGGDGGDGGD
jgi:hypothetical protein